MKLNRIAVMMQIGLFALLLSLSLNSCSDPVKGCTDPDAETYNADAEESDDSQCVYARDKFIGSFKGSLICPGSLNGFFNNPVYDYTISETAGGAVNQVTLGLTVLGAPTNLAATVSGNTITLNQTIPNVPIPGIPVPANILATGTATISADGKTLSGNINISVSASVLPAPITDICPITGTKQ